MIPERHVWVFLGTERVSGAFTSCELGEEWIARHGLTGTLSALPLDEGVFDWAVRCNALNLKPEKLPAKSRDPDFIGNCLTASLEHFHYDRGKRMQ